VVQEELRRMEKTAGGPHDERRRGEAAEA
jgi:hypothetical protein